MRQYFFFSLLLMALLSFTACKREAATQDATQTTEAPNAAAVLAPPPAPRNLPATWPTGEALTLTLAPAADATTLIKALYESGDVVLEQTWPDGRKERWWYAPDGTGRYIGFDGVELALERAL